MTAQPIDCNDAQIISFNDLQLARSHYDAWTERNAQVMATLSPRQRKRERRKMMLTILKNEFIMNKLRARAKQERAL